MVSSTKKLGPSGRYGARYGALARKQVTTVERVQRKKHTCERCGAAAVQRVSTGIWACRKCDHQFAGGAYIPVTGPGRGAKKALRGINDKLMRGSSDEVASFHEAMEDVEDEYQADEADADVTEVPDEAEVAEAATETSDSDEEN